MSLEDFITIQLSAKIYWGYQYKIKKNRINMMSRDEIIAEVKTSMKNFFTVPYDLFLLREGVDKLELHFHGNDPFDNNSTIVYLCDHCH